MSGYLGIDYGSHNIGLAVSEMGIAIPYDVWDTYSFFETLPDLIKKKNITIIVVWVAIGYDPYGKQAKVFHSFIKQLREFVGDSIQVYEQDEDLTTFEAQAALDAFETKEHLDDVAASIILQRYLDEQG